MQRLNVPIVSVSDLWLQSIQRSGCKIVAVFPSPARRSDIDNGRNASSATQSPRCDRTFTASARFMKRFFYPALRRAGLRQVSFHSLRYSNASFKIHAVQNIKYMQGQLGHASINMTLDVYGHLFNDLDFNKKQVESLEAVRKPLERPAALQYASL